MMAIFSMVFENGHIEGAEMFDLGLGDIIAALRHMNDGRSDGRYWIANIGHGMIIRTDPDGTIHTW